MSAIDSAGATTTSARAPAREWHTVREASRATLHLGAREVRLVLRTPGLWIPNLITPLLFFFVIVGSLSELAGQSGVENYAAFQLPFVLLFSAQGGSAGLNMVNDIESGYFDKLLLTPASRLAILIGAMGADFIRIVVQGLIVAVVALATGMDFATGILGLLVMVVLASLWGLAFSAMGFAIALKTGNPQATQNTWLMVFPLLFLTTGFAPLERLSGWLATAARFNPITYLLRGLRSLSVTGWDAGEIGVALLAIAGLGAITLTLAFRALLGRVR